MVLVQTPTDSAIGVEARTQESNACERLFAAVKRGGQKGGMSKDPDDSVVEIVVGEFQDPVEEAAQVFKRHLLTQSGSLPICHSSDGP